MQHGKILKTRSPAITDSTTFVQGLHSFSTTSVASVHNPSQSTRRVNI